MTEATLTEANSTLQKKEEMNTRGKFMKGVANQTKVPEESKLADIELETRLSVACHEEKVWPEDPKEEMARKPRARRSALLHNPKAAQAKGPKVAESV